MAYIGKTPVIGNFQKCDSIAVVNGQAAYTLQVGGTNVSPQSENHMLVSLNGILQAPVDSFTVSGSTLTFASNLITGDVIDFVMILGNVLDLGVPSDNTVTTAKLADSSVSLAKLTATGTKDATTFLRGDNSFQGVPAGGITEADQWRLTASASGSVNPISSNLERVDTQGLGYFGTGMSVSSGIWTFPSTGYWLVNFHAEFASTASIRQFSAMISTTTDGSSYDQASRSWSNTYDFSTEHNTGVTTQILFDCQNTSTHKLFFKTEIDGGSSAVSIIGNTGQNYTTFTFIRLGDT